MGQQDSRSSPRPPPGRPPFEPPRARPPDADLGAPIGRYVPGLMKKLGLQDRLWQERLLQEWEQLVGPQVARHTRPGRVERKTLFIFVSNSAWLSELQRYGQTEILATLQSAFGADKIRQIRLQQDPDGGVGRHT